MGIKANQNNIVLYNSKESCCGCGACYNICPSQAIYMEPDEFGFVYPQINHDKCIKCNLCKTVCAYQNVAEINVPIETYVAVTKNTDIIQSASGGVFASVAKSTLEQGGVVYGASLEILNEKLTPIHIRVDDLNALIKLQGSKYVQSSIGNTYQQAQEDLENNKRVLFSGTPCQIAGLKAFLKKDYNNLFCIDIICHGAPSAKFFQDYIGLIERKYNSKAVDFKFRDKKKGWGSFYSKAIFKSNNKDFTKLISGDESSYYKLFLTSATYRENCYTCKYAAPNRSGDITIGDYWGIEIEHPELIKKETIKGENGVSCCIVNTEKGKKYVGKYKDGLCLHLSSFDKVAKYNNQLFEPSKMNGDREAVLNVYKSSGYNGVEKWFRKNQGIKFYIGKIKKMLPRKVIIFIKSIIRKKSAGAK